MGLGLNMNGDGVSIFFSLDFHVPVSLIELYENYPRCL